MSHTFSIGHRSLKLNGLFAGLACAITLTLAVGPALAAPAEELARVEVAGRTVEAPLRYDVHASCAGIEAQLENALQATWARERSAGKVLVQFVMDNGEINGVKARGLSHKVSRSVAKAVSELQCGPQATVGTQIYRFRVDFIDPYDMPFGSADTRTAGAQSGIRLALANE